MLREGSGVPHSPPLGDLGWKKKEKAISFEWSGGYLSGRFAGIPGLRGYFSGVQATLSTTIK